MEFEDGRILISKSHFNKGKHKNERKWETEREIVLTLK